MKAWSQNLGHEGVLTIFMSYGQVSMSRQGDIICHLGVRKELPHMSIESSSGVQSFVAKIVEAEVRRQIGNASG